jgi:hypothetical protein
MLKHANEIINNAISKANEDLNNPDLDLSYSPEYLIDLLSEIKQVMNTPIETTMDASDIRNFHQMD